MQSLRAILIGCSLALALLAVVAAGVLVHFAGQEVTANSEEVVVTQRILECVAGVHADLAEADRGATAYALTGGDVLLPAYEGAVQQKDRKIALLRDALQGDPAQLGALDKLEQLITRRCATAAQMIRVRREQGPDAARQIVMSGDAARLMDEIRTGLETMRSQETDRLAELGTKATDSSVALTRIAIGGSVAVLVLVGAAIGVLFWALRSGSKAKESASSFGNALILSLIDNIADAVYVKDGTGRFQLANRAYRKLLTGDETKEIAGKTVYDLATPRVAEQQDRDDQAVIRAQAPFLNRVERGGLPGEPETQWFQTSKVPMFDEKGECTLIYGITRDITQVRKLQDEVDKAKAQVEQAARTKTDFLANMSHEIRTPMNGILGMIELSMDTDLTEQQHEYLALCKNSAQSLLDLLNDIMDYTRGEVGAITLENVPFDLQEVVTQVVTPLTLRALEKNLRLTWRCAADAPRWLRGDPNRLRQVLVNLVGNAIKFTDTGEIFLEIKQESGKRHETTLQFSVRDTGIGVPESKREEIFEAFNQADTSHTRQFGGTGLGLTIAASLVKLMGGRIWLDSIVSNGSTFYFTAIFGISEEIKPTKTVEAVGAVPSSLNGLNVLVVDHDYNSRRVLEELLMTWQLKPTLVGGGAVALDELWQAFQDGCPFPLVLVEARMPQMDGFELCRLVKREPELQDTKLVLLSSVPDLLKSDKISSVGIDAGLPKPVNPPDLLEVVKRLCSGGQDASAPFSWGTGGAAGEPGRGSESGMAVSSVNGVEMPVVETDGRATHSLTVLVTEDNPVNQAVAAGLLGKRGHKVLRANNGLEAVKLFETNAAIDVILMDIQMPEMDGHSATKHIRRAESGTGRHVPIIAVTAHAMKGDRERCLASGMDAYLSKPFPKEELVRLVEGFAVAPQSSVESQPMSYASVAASSPAPAAVAVAAVPAAVAAPSSASRGVVVSTREQLVENLGDEELVVTLIDIFLDQTPKLLDELDAAVIASNVTGVERTAHSLKGSAGNFGAKNAWQLAQTVEYAARGGDLSNAADAAKQLRGELDLVMGALKAIK